MGMGGAVGTLHMDHIDLRGEHFPFSGPPSPECMAGSTHGPHGCNRGKPSPYGALDAMVLGSAYWGADWGGNHLRILLREATRMATVTVGRVEVCRPVLGCLLFRDRPSQPLGRSRGRSTDSTRQAIDRLDAFHAKRTRCTVYS